jgi:hypothetical protein
MGASVNLPKIANRLTQTSGVVLASGFETFSKMVMFYPLYVMAY